MMVRVSLKPGNWFHMTLEYFTQVINYVLFIFWNLALQHFYLYILYLHVLLFYA